MIPPFRWPEGPLRTRTALKEPLSPESPLWDMENLLLSPHNADLTPTPLGFPMFYHVLPLYLVGGFKSWYDFPQKWDDDLHRPTVFGFFQPPTVETFQLST